jgi:hypothetical protein
VNDHELSVAIEGLLVARNPRRMQVARAALVPGYCRRAARLLRGVTGPVLIGTGFPVGETFETDGPVGAIALYRALAALGAEPLLACAPPLSAALAGDFRVLELTARDLSTARRRARQQLAALRPAAVLAIECPGLAADHRYYNMRGEDITVRCAFFDPFLEAAECPTIAIGDGGNEAGMGKIAEAIAGLDIRAAITGCDELLVADVSNWAAYGLIALLGCWGGRDLLGEFSPLATLRYLSERGSVDGVTRENTLTEDGLQPAECLAVIRELRILTGFAQQ